MKLFRYSIVIFIVSLFLIIPVFAESKDIVIKDISIVDKSSTITAEDPVVENNKITSLLKFNQENDYVTYKITIQNKEEDKYKIASISDNASSNLLIEYDYSDEYIDKDGTRDVLITLKYKTTLINANKSLSSLKINFEFENENGNTSTLGINPFTGDSIIPYLGLFFISMIGFIVIFIKDKKLSKNISMFILISLLAIPFITYARCDFELQLGFTNATIIGEFEEYNVSIDALNGDAVINRTITYGEVVGELPEVSKDLYTFEKWIDQDGNEVTADTIVTKELVITASWLSNCHDFATDSWSTIHTNITNNPTYYGVGCTKPITIDIGSGNEVHNLRIANNTTPSVCSTTGYSQTACGVVLEFEDILGYQVMNPWDEHVEHTNGNGNVGGWEYSSMRIYLNDEFYLALPSDLRSVIQETYVVSSYAKNESTNYYTNDNVYLFSPKEIWGEENELNPIESDSTMDLSRQLDYYKNKNVTLTSYTGAIKKLGNEPENWWLRSASNTHINRFFVVEDDGNHHRSKSNNSTDGYSPAFRIH